MTYTDKEYGLEVWGDMACFTRPELKVERVSYDVITPSAARNIFQAIFWKPAIQWEVTRIEVLNPIRHFSVRRNEVGAIGSAKPDAAPIIATEKRQQKNSIMLRDVRYRIYARMVYQPPRLRKGESAHKPGPDENPAKYQAMFERRASKGQCFTMPYLGTRECSAFFTLLPEGAKGGEDLLKESRDFGLMLYDLDFSDPRNIIPMFYYARMTDGVIEVPTPGSEEVMK
ncbi:MAG: type I-C CRISPR-associated protein Cas5c [Paramuribaculum sp.]|nr:type I-C CRISPR-associated protein Cas5 [Bacteroides sp.]MBD5376200.1 type I-C CRISPR-associated protein Cas5 [Bacteroides sp.]MDE7459777.1 type I-C CRISPR-associated protein Cas5c [Paramuribaculum sp.]